ncbi:MAG: serine acetyltransferase [Bacteroidaceae bacterium]|nr:serine acetyltransferase [Bacteroidaceae bacterium]
MQSILSPDHIARLTHSLSTSEEHIPAGHADGILPARIEECVCLFRDIVFAGYFSPRPVMESVSQLSRLLAQQICESIRIHPTEQCGVEQTTRFMDRIPALRRTIGTDVKAMFDGDPAATSHEEIILCYPAITALVHYRMAHALHQLGVPILPRIITEMAHARTGIDIHPGAQIGEYFAIDHGTGVVIGETCIIGRHVRLYQGVTLGAKSFRTSPDGTMLNLPRHPILEDRVVIYSNATVLGRITIGHDSVIGGNVWQTEALPPYSRVLQGRTQRDLTYIDGAGI